MNSIIVLKEDQTLNVDLETVTLIHSKPLDYIKGTLKELGLNEDIKFIKEKELKKTLNKLDKVLIWDLAVPFVKAWDVSKLLKGDSFLVDEEGKDVGIYCFSLKKNKTCLKAKTLKDIEDDAHGKMLNVCIEKNETTRRITSYQDVVEISNDLKLTINNYWIKLGVQIMDPNNTYIDIRARIEENAIIFPNVSIIGFSKIAKCVTIGSGSYIENAIIGEYTSIEASKIIDSRVDTHCSIGPYAHLRGNTHVHDNARIGNFVEFKNCDFNEGSKCAHLTYLGDSEVGSNVNIGCGVVTVNYDGKDKFKTIIKDGAFIGSNVNIIAPVIVGENAVLAAGSTITKDVSNGDLAIARSRQSVKPGFGTVYKNKSKRSN
ncbi:MAG: DapH/DapD/GlmU-related protein [Erysipelotrichaceae bacterium]